MKKGVPFLILGVLLISGLGAVATPDADQEYLTLHFHDLTITDDHEYTTITLQGTNSQLIRPNHYIMPTHTETYYYPLGTTITDIICEATNIKTQPLSKPLDITPQPVPVGIDTQHTTITESQPAQTINTWYDYDIGVGIVNNIRQTIVKVTIYPLQYNPETQQITWANTIHLTIKDQPPTETTGFEDQYDFLILTADQFADELNPLVTHKESNNIATKLVTLTEIYSGTIFEATGRDNQEKIKYFIKNAIETWGITNVMLVGDGLKFPYRITHVNAGQGDKELFASDLYYADIYNETFEFSSWDTNENDIFGEYDWPATDDVDLYPDVHLGRLACVNGGEVTAVVNKIKTYETNQAYTLPWFNNLVLVGGDSFPGDSDGAYEGEVVNDAVANKMSGFTPTRLWASNGKLTQIAPSGVANINSAFNDGAGWFDFSGHGNTMIWCTHPPEDDSTWIPTNTGGYFNFHVEALSNGNKLPIVITGACSVAKYNTDNDCFSWAMVANANGGGIGSFGAAGLGWAYLGNGVTQGLIEGMCINMFEAYAYDDALTLGEMWAKALEDYINPGMEGTDYKTVEEWQPFCDPTTAIGAQSNPPLKPEDLDGPTKPNYQETHTYTASTTDPDNDQLYYLFDWGDDTYSGWVGPYNPGQTAQASHKWSRQGNYEIRVRAKDDHGKLGEWSDPLPITTPYNSPYHYNILENILNHLFERHPLLEHILQSRPLISSLLGL